MAEPSTRDNHPRACVFCGAFHKMEDIILVSIDTVYVGTTVVEKTYTEVNKGYAGIRAICTGCLNGLVGIHEARQ